MNHKILSGLYIRLTMEVTPSDMNKQFPGFPPFVHVIMAEIANGSTVDEAAAAVERFHIKDHIQNAIDRSAVMPNDLRLAYSSDETPSDDAGPSNNFLD